ncbi:ABC transporter permease [Rheinheimera sp.]|uniref:ABC transporter permease n=1 Tax=Rheinheimera sp. TaxID=1869214 RepID=UPI00307E7CA7
MLMVKAAWDYRHFIMSSIKAEMGGRYARSRLGALWFILHPLATAAVLALVLSQFLGSRLPGIESKFAYAVYLLSGMVGWSLFAETTQGCITMFRDRANLLKKVSFPKVCIPLIVVGSTVLNHLLFILVVIFLVWLLGVTPSVSLLMLPVFIMLSLGLAVGIGLTLSVFDVFNRDVGNIWQIVIQFWFWLTPIVYVFSTLSNDIAVFMQYNPMMWVIQGYQQAIAYQTISASVELLWVAGLALWFLVIGFCFFMRASSDIVDEL